MKKKLCLLLLMSLCLSSLCIHAQDNTLRQIYNKAESEYEIGHIDQAIQLLQANIDAFDGLLKQSAYRLLALCHLSEDRDEEARYYAERLIKLNNYYNSTDDPARFQDLVSLLKGGITTTITTASSQSETIEEAPVPITIITAEMIEELGYNKNLNQILAAYVPGMSEVTSLEEGVNLSMHGAYANGQELILVMENGHRLNTRVDNCGSTSYSISTEKIDHIEVLRGPASSLYGNVALSAVVNIITKSGRTLDGVKAKYGYGTFGTHKADFTIGTQFMDADIFAWASIYKSNGQIRHFGDGEAYLANLHSVVEGFGDNKGIYHDPDMIYVDGYKDAPAYDVGLTFKLKGFELMFSRKNVKKVQSHTSAHGGYDYDRYSPCFGVKPGHGTESTHAEISYTRQLKAVNLNALLYSDWYDISNYEVQMDSVEYFYPARDENDEIIIDKNGNVLMVTTSESGHFIFNHYREHTMGGYVKATANYRIANMKGNILVGSQYEHFSLKSAQNFWGTKFSLIDDGLLDLHEIIDAGKENSLSFFMQDKHYFMPKIILNAGFRYDLKYRQKEDVVRSFSPRLALLYVPNERFSLKLSYSEAFADLSFFYRYVSNNDYYNKEPQHLSALQLTAMGKMPQMHLTYEVNLFYNKYANLLCWHIRDWTAGVNSGRLTNVGIEGTANYAYKRFSTILSFYYCHDNSSKNYYYDTQKQIVCGVPHFTLNLHAAYLLIYGKNHELKVYGHSTYEGRKRNYSYSEEDNFNVDANMRFDLGIRYLYKQRLRLSLDCENIFDTDHYVCGAQTTLVPDFQRGRTMMASLSVQF
ncbi:MAG: TonB-dependent receptor [Prevotella sp.]|nr:TonB-dependent receptor [Prevotella sp.]